MGLLDKLGKVAKDVGKTIIDTGKSIKKEIDDSQEIKRKKRAILSRFTMNNLKKICYECGTGEPSKYISTPETIITGKQEKRNLTRDLYIDYIIHKLDLDQIKDSCFKHRLPLPDFIQKEQNIKPSSTQQPEININEVHRTVISQETPIQPSNEFDDILNLISKFKPEPFLDEKELQSQLKVMLDSKYPNKVFREVGTQLGGKIDFAIDRKYGIEVKPILGQKNTSRFNRADNIVQKSI